MDPRQDRARGVLIGLAAGDRNGGPVRIALRLAESLAERRAFDPDDILARYLEWWHDGAFDTGPTTATVLGLIDRGVDPAEAVRLAHERAGGMSAGCNPAHRCAPLAMARGASSSDETLARQAVREALLTHHDPLAGDVAAAVAVLCRALIEGDAWTDALGRAAVGRLEPTRQALAPQSARARSNGGFAPDALQAAVHFVDRHGDFARALGDSIAFAGSANYCPVLVGAIAGARDGAAAIAPSLLEHAGMLLLRLAGATEALADGWAEGQGTPAGAGPR